MAFYRILRGTSSCEHYIYMPTSVFPVLLTDFSPQKLTASSFLTSAEKKKQSHEQYSLVLLNLVFSSLSVDYRSFNLPTVPLDYCPVVASTWQKYCRSSLSPLYFQPCNPICEPHTNDQSIPVYKQILTACLFPPSIIPACSVAKLQL